MKKKIQCVLFLLILLSMVSMASAAEERANQRRYMLYQGSNVVASWSAQGTGSVIISESVPVKKGCEYTMSLTWSVAGQWQRSVFTKGTCPG